MKRLHIALVAGERSGDLLGGGLIQALKKRFPGARFSGVGGESMQAAGLEALFSSQRLAVMGLVEVLAQLPDLYRAQREILDFYRRQPPDMFIGIDAPDFNLRLAEALHGRGITTVHYVSPSLWAWKEKRIHRIARCVDLMLCLFPFETAIYTRHGVPAVCVGHAMAERLQHYSREAARSALNLPQNRPLLGLFVGSRRGEIQRLLPIFLQAYQSFKRENPHWEALLSLQEERPAWRRQAEALPGVHIVAGRSNEALAACDFLLLKSGTITLEAALLQRPAIVAHRVHPLTAFIAKRLLKIQHFALPNLLLQREIMPEFIQDACRAEMLAAALQQYAPNHIWQAQQRQAFGELEALLPRDSSQRAAAAIADFWTQSSSGK